MKFITQITNCIPPEYYKAALELIKKGYIQIPDSQAAADGGSKVVHWFADRGADILHGGADLISAGVHLGADVGIKGVQGCASLLDGGLHVAAQYLHCPRADDDSSMPLVGDHAGDHAGDH